MLLVSNVSPFPSQSSFVGPGSAPNEIVALPMPGQGINVEWTTPDDVNGKIDNYVIQYGEIAEGEKKEQ